MHILGSDLDNIYKFIFWKYELNL